MTFRSMIKALGILCTALLAVQLSNCAGQTQQSIQNAVQQSQDTAPQVELDVSVEEMIHSLSDELEHDDDSEEVACEAMELDPDMVSLEDVLKVADTVKSSEIQRILTEPMFHLTTDDVISELREKHQLQCESIEKLENDSIKNAGYDKIELLSCLSPEKFQNLISSVRRFCELEEKKKIFSETTDVNFWSLDDLNSSQLSELYDIVIDEEVCKWVDTIHNPSEVPSYMEDENKCTSLCSDDDTDIYLSITKDGKSSVWSVYKDIDVHLEERDNYLNSASMKLAGFSTSKLLELPAIYVRLKYILREDGSSCDSRSDSDKILYTGMLFVGDEPKLSAKWIDLYMNKDEGYQHDDITNEETGIEEDCEVRHESTHYMQKLMQFDGEWHQSVKFGRCYNSNVYNCGVISESDDDD